jgi:acetyl esterase/lipase
MLNPVASGGRISRRFFAVLAVTISLGIGRAQYAEPLPDVATYGDKLVIRSNVAFGDARWQQMDVYLPTPGVRGPAVVCWFGGSFRAGNRYQFSRLAAYLADHGVAAITPEYFLGARDGSTAAWPQAVYDAKTAVRWVRAHAAELNIDPERIYALGYSSGAYLAMMVGFTPNLTELEGGEENRDVSSRVAAVVEISGVADRRRDVGIPLSLLGKGYEGKWDLRVATSPIIYLSPATVPVYILHGRKDPVAEVSCATQLAEALVAVKVPHVLRLVDADHAPVTAAELDLVISWLKQLPGHPAPAAPLAPSKPAR